MSFAAIPAIVAICYYVAELFKWGVSNDNGEITNNKVKRFIPILCGATGMILGITSYYSSPSNIQADNLLTAAAIGLTSGLASVGVYQTYKKKK